MLKPVKNPPNPFESTYREFLEEAPQAELKFYEEQAKSILSKNESPDLSFRWSLNPYRGCYHGCAYCYARPSHEYLGFGSGTDFETKIVIKKNAPELLKKAFLSPRWKGELIVFSGNTDCYQPAEAAYRLTQRCLETCLEFRNPVGIITKSFLILRDKELIARLAQESCARVFVSIPFFDEKEARAIEPQAASVSRRLEVIQKLSELGVPVGVSVAPIIPGFNDDDIPQILKAARERGATTAFYTLLRLAGNVKNVFFERIKERFPMRYEKILHRIQDSHGGKIYDPRFFKRHEGQGTYWKVIENLFELYVKKLGFNQEKQKPSVSAFRIPSPQPELPLTL
ncbi:MAG: PA0069 family radical SAM protein [Elusimicrobia bacterium]|nr:PA0069 family radical SAM protein [Elusimicrobiota bacterium]